MKKLSVEEKTQILLAVFVTALVAANLLGNKITILLGISVAVGIFTYPLTFLVANIIGEVHGKKATQHFIFIGFIVLFLTLIFTALSVWLPAAERFTFNTEYTTVFTFSLRITIASLIAFGIAQFNNSILFNKLRTKYQQQNSMLHYNASVIVSQLIDTVVFYFIAFYHMTPKFTAGFIVTLIIPYWFMKILFSLFSTPLYYGGVQWLKKDVKPSIPPMRVPVAVPQVSRVPR